MLAVTAKAMKTYYTRKCTTGTSLVSRADLPERLLRHASMAAAASGIDLFLVFVEIYDCVYPNHTLELRCFCGGQRYIPSTNGGKLEQTHGARLCAGLGRYG